MDKSPSSPRPFSAPRYALTLLAVLLAWTGLYVSIQPLATWLTFDLLSLTPGGAPGLALEFFLYDSAKILLLLVLMVYCIGWLRAGLHVERVRDYLSGKGRGIGYLLGATFGAITPFCSCSSIPLFLGFTMARIPLGITMAFLITSPLINEIAVVLLWGLLGWKFTVVYVVVGMAAGMLGGWLLDLLRAERWLQPFLRGMLGVSGQAARDERNTRLGLEERHRFAWDEMTGIFRRVWRWVIIGVGLGGAPARLCAAGLVCRPSGPRAVVVRPGGRPGGHPPVQQCHGRGAHHGEPAAQGPARGHHPGLLHEHCGRQPARDAHAQAGHALAAAGPFPGPVAGHLHPGGLAVQQPAAHAVLT